MIRFIDLTSNLTGKRIIFALDDIANVIPSAGPTVGAWINSKTAGIPGVLVRESSDEIMRRIERWSVDSDQSYYNVRRYELVKPKADTAEVPFADESRDRARHALEPLGKPVMKKAPGSSWQDHVSRQRFPSGRFLTVLFFGSLLSFIIFAALSREPTGNSVQATPPGVMLPRPPASRSLSCHR